MIELLVICGFFFLVAVVADSLVRLQDWLDIRAGREIEKQYALTWLKGAQEGYELFASALVCDAKRLKHIENFEHEYRRALIHAYVVSAISFNTFDTARKALSARSIERWTASYLARSGTGPTAS